MREDVEYFRHWTHLICCQCPSMARSGNLDHITGACIDKSPHVLSLRMKNEAKLSDVFPRH